MSLIVATPKATNANSYLTVARAKSLLSLRLYASSWDAGQTPDAENYQVNHALGYAGGTSTLAVDGGVGTFTVGSKVQFAGHATEYTVTEALAAAGNLKISPALTSAVADDEAITRLTPNDQERALVWATSLLDSMMDWKGVPTTTTQALRWPRYGLYNRDVSDVLDWDTIPADIEQATAELALALLGRDRFAMPELLGQGIVQASVGSLSVTVDPSQVVSIIPDNVLALVAHLGVLLPQAGTGTKTLPLQRA